MRSFRKWGIAAALVSAAVMRGELSEWVQHLAVETGLRSVFFRQMTLPSGAIDGRRPPRETRPELTRQIAAHPENAALFRLRAGEAELTLDFAAAEVDWKQFAQRTGDRMALADFYHRRLRPADEIATLDAIATPAAFERAIAVADAQGLPETAVSEQYRAWIAKLPDDASLRKRFIRRLTDRRQFAAAEAEIAAYRRAFPADDSAWTEEVSLALKRGAVDDAVAVFDKSFRPQMPAESLKRYFDLLNGQGRLRDFLAQARSAAAARPEALDPVARQFHYYQHEQNAAAARRILLEYRARKRSWAPGELYDTAKLLENVQEWDQAARLYYALYSLPASDDAARERGLAGLVNLLLTAPEQPVHFGAGDLSLYKDIATMDPHPGFLNGILSLVLNTSWPRSHYDAQNQASVAYFHRAAASELLELLDAKWPRAAEAPVLHARLIETYATYTDNDGVIRAGRKFLTAYPQAEQRSRVALAMADAFARLNRSSDEFAIYDLLLKELADRAKGVPIGEIAPPAEAAPPQAPAPPVADFAPPPAPAPPAAPTYASVLDRYIGRLVSLRRAAAALELYRREIDRNPKDPGLYEKLAAFLDQSRMAGEVEQVYKQAAAKFPDGSWNDKLARFYLRYRRTQDFAALTRQVAQIFSGTELERYFRDVVGGAVVDPLLYRQVNLYAHERFPDDLAFVRNLLTVYARRETADGAAYASLLRSYWYYDAQLRARFFEGLARSGTLDRELTSLRGADSKANPAAARFLAEGESWRGHFEQAAPVMRALATDFPGDGDLVLRAATLERSLGHTEAAAALARNLSLAVPRDREALARIGDIYAERELFARARPYWNRMPQVEPGKSEGYLDAATVFWDYYRYDDALRLITEGRSRFNQPALFAYEAGAIYEGKRDFTAALRQYAKAAEAGSPAEARLLNLAQRTQYRPVVDSVTAASTLRLRIAVLEAEKRRPAVENLLKTAIPTETSAASLGFVQETAARLGFAEVQQLALERQIAVTRDPVEKLRLRLSLMRLEESRKDVAAAQRTIEELERENPAVLGVIRASVDFYSRNKMPAQAIATLTAAAGRANAGYRRDFTFEAARKSTDAGQFAQARQLLLGLLAADPFNGPYLAAMADTYAQAGDDRGLRDFYHAGIDTLKASGLPPDDRETRIAGLRRGFIPALARLGQNADAVDQYIELIKRYPEDQGLIREAANFAGHHSLAPRITAYYAKASTDSPKDYRWPMVAGRLATHFEDFDAAITAYTRAIAVRPDRTDLYLNRGALEERLMRFAEAERTYTKVWELSYRDPQWLEKVAELEARQHQPDAAVATLRKAYLEGRPARPELLFAIAADLERYGLLPQAAEFARQAGSGELDPTNARIYARILTRTRQYTEALAKVSGIGAGLEAMAEAVNQYYSPEEKAAFAAELEKHAGAGPLQPWILLASRAGLRDLQARWTAQSIAQPAGPGSNEYALIELQNRRMRFDELGRQLEELAARRPQPEIRTRLLEQAAQAYTSIGDTAGLERVFAAVPQSTQYLRTIAQGDPSKLLRWAAVRNDAVDLAIASGDAGVALRAVAARAGAMPPIWGKAYTALTSLYYWPAAPDATAIFRQALGTGTIGERLGKPVDLNQQFVGSGWFYYGARFGEYLDLRRAADADDYLFAALEAAPGRPAAYSELGGWHAERGAPAKALVEYEHALELNPESGATQDRIASVLWDLGRRDEAIAHWKQSLAEFQTQQGRPNLANEFWPQVGAALTAIGEHKLAAELRAEVDSLLRAYVARHDAYRIDALTGPVARYGLIDVETAPLEVLQHFAGRETRGRPDRLAILRRLIFLAGSQSGGNVDWRVAGWQAEITDLLLDAGDVAGARSAFATLPEGSRPELEIRLSARSGQLAALLERYRRRPETAPPTRQLQRIAAQMIEKHEDAAADRLLEFVYSRELDAGNFDASNFVGLAEVRLKAGDQTEAMALLRRMQLLSGEPFENLLPAADLLEKYGRKTEAAGFVRDRVRAVPWDAAARLRLGQDLAAIVIDVTAPYAVRVGAARAGGAGGAGELAVLARGRISAAEANRPYYFDALLAAARETADAAVQTQLLLDAIAVSPDDPAPVIPLFRAAFQAKRYDLALQAANRAHGSADVAVAREMAAVYERFEDYWNAANVLRGARRPELQQEIANLDRRAQIKAQNETRRPVVTAGVDQQSVVRPRIEK